MKNEPSLSREPHHDEPSPASGERLATPSGASAWVRDDRIEVRDAGGRLLFEYDAATGRGSLSVPAGDLSLRAPEGNIEIDAGGTVSLKGTEVSLAGQRARMLFAEAEVRGVRVMAAVEQALLVADRLEQVASSVFQRAKQVVRQVEGLEQLTAGRVRTLVKGAYSIKGERASIQAENEVKIDGERVHIG